MYENKSTTDEYNNTQQLTNMIIVWDIVNKSYSTSFCLPLSWTTCVPEKTKKDWGEK